MSSATTITNLLVGQIQEFGDRGQLSAYLKHKVEGRIFLDRDGLSSDDQADKKHHGGVDKALFQYCSDHYEFWRQQRPALASYFNRIGAFGENLSADKLNEENVCIGDRFKIANAIVEVSQGRQPCWKLGHYFNDPSMVKAVVDTAKGGWYYRVIERDYIAPGQLIELIDRPHPLMTVKKVFEVLVARKKDDESLKQLNEISELSESWRTRAKQMYRRRSNANWA